MKTRMKTLKCACGSPVRWQPNQNNVTLCPRCKSAYVRGQFVVSDPGDKNETVHDLTVGVSDPIGTYDAYAEWLASHPQGYLYLKQAISALAWQLQKTGNLPMMRQAVDEVIGAERALVNEKLKAPNSDSGAVSWASKKDGK